jgi:hypothetical protein
MVSIVHSMTHRAKVYKNSLVSKFRQATWKSRVLPQFIIIGAMKSGTTSLFHYLSQHPQLVPSNPKETHYFDGGSVNGVDEYQYGISWYLRHFPRKSQISDSQQTFEASPSYLFHPLAAGRIHETIPDAKLIVLLRNPTARAISHYLHKKRTGIEKLPIMEALQQEEIRLAPILATNDYFNRGMRHFSYKARGLYKIQLDRYFELFPREQLLILPSEGFFAEPLDVLQQIYDFIGVDPEYQVVDLSPKLVAKNREKIDDEVIDYLNDYFRPHNQVLFELLGVDYGWK